VTPLVVADSTIWSNFAHAEPPGLARLAFPGIASPRQVLEEVEEGRRLGYLGTFELGLIEEVVLTDAEAAMAAELERNLGRGEAACLAVGEFRKVLVLTDDRAARKVARSRGVQVSGTLGVLARLVDGETLSASQADDLLAAMMRAGYRSPVTSLAEIL
jgi:predicted nucleic acid-binding protein